jgi:hypothetical protein
MSVGTNWRLCTVLLLAVVLMPGCWRPGRAKAPAIPAAPVAVASAEPLSVPQTTVHLPPWQPIPAEAVPPEPEAAPPTLTPTPAPERPVTPPPPRPRPAAKGATVEPPPSAPPAPVRPPPAGGQLRPMLTASQEQDLQRRLDRSIIAAEKVLAQVGSAPQHQTEVERVRSFIEQAQQARHQGDLVRATSLAERAELLASGVASSPK